METIQVSGESSESPAAELVPSNSSTESENYNHKTKLQVKGARKIWGTMAESTVRSVKNAITRFCNIAPSGLYVKRKNKVTVPANKNVWWYVIHADEEVLCDMENKWEPIQLQLRWKLEHCFMSVATNQSLSVSVHETSQTTQQHAQPSSNSNADDAQSESAEPCVQLTTNEDSLQTHSQVRAVEGGSQSTDTLSSGTIQENFLEEGVVSHTQT